MSDADGDTDDTRERAAEVLGHLYALAAAHICEDQGAIALLLEDVPASACKAMPEAALAIACTSVRMFRNGDDPFDDPRVAVLPDWMLDALASMLEGVTPDFIPLRGEDATGVSIRTVGAFWLWAAHGEQGEALRIARRHCAGMVLYRDESQNGRRDGEGWN